METQTRKPAYRIGRYLKYAIGEIVLVVIGILIALQINNWNEKNKTHEFEIKMLNEIQMALTEDLNNFQLMSKRMNRLHEHANSMVSLIADGVPYSDSLSSSIFRLNVGISTQYNRGPYDAIKASGIDKIANASIRNQLIYFYDFLYPRFISNLEHYNRNYTKNIEKIVGLQQDPVIQKVENKAIITQKFEENIFERPEFLRTIRSIIFRSSSLEIQMKEFIPVIKDIITQLESEIGISHGEAAEPITK